MMIPNQSYFFSGIGVTLYFSFLFSFVLHTLASPNLHHCRDDQRDALLEFKHEFPSTDMDSTSFLRSWNKSSDCCSWRAVTCDAKSGKVISLDLLYEALNNTLKPNSAVFKLQYLQTLGFMECNLYGEIPSSIGNFSHLTTLNLRDNAFVGQVPASIGNLTQLRSLNLGQNQLSGKVSLSFANLTKLTELDLTNNYFEPELLPDMSRFHNLEELFLGGGNFFGPFPKSLFTIPSLQWVSLRGNNFTGTIDFGNMSLSSRELSSRFMALDLADNKFHGPIPESISTFLDLRVLDLSNNLFSGLFPTSISKFRKLRKLDLSNNLFFGLFPTSLFTNPLLRLVDLGGNNFTGPIDFGNMSLSSTLELLRLDDNKFNGQIPESISKFLNLGELDFSNNKLEGKVPGFLWGMESLKLSHNFLSSFEKSSEVLNQREMNELRLDSNSFHGPFPHWICERRLLKVLDLSNNSFNGAINPCLRNFTASLVVLNLRSNNFSGILPDVFVNATNLSALDVSRNRLEGKLPKTLIHCEAMKFLNVEGNIFKDKFPSWLGSLPLLSVLILRSNQFYGQIYQRHISIGYQNIKVIDVSHNDFTGTFPAFYFSKWFEMRQMTTLNPEIDAIYMGYPIGIDDFYRTKDYGSYNSTMEMVHKGVDTEFEKIRRDFKTIDFSRNKFYGKIPESIGLLKGLRSLNLSGNAFTSDIPQSLANLTNLEALDLSQNQLSGQIPRDLGTLNFLSTMNFSYNNLEGPIPKGTQFQRQNCSSFMNNPKLNGLEEICGETHVPNPTSQESEEVPEPEENVINWVAAAIAYGPGVFCGLVIGHIFSSYNEWLMEKFRTNKSRRVIRSNR